VSCIQTKKDIPLLAEAPSGVRFGACSVLCQLHHIRAHCAAPALGLGELAH
jgi:hypothetical protein